MAHSRFILSVQHKHVPAPIGVSVPSRTHEAPSPFKIARTTVYPKCCRRHVHLRQAGGCIMLVQSVCHCGSNINNMCSGMFMCVFLWVRGHWLLSLNIYWQRVWGLRDIFINCPVQPDSRWNLCRRARSQSSWAQHSISGCPDSWQREGQQSCFQISMCTTLW